MSNQDLSNLEYIKYICQFCVFIVINIYKEVYISQFGIFSSMCMYDREICGSSFIFKKIDQKLKPDTLSNRQSYLKKSEN